MKIIDLSHTLKNGMPFFPGTKKPEFKTFSTVENEGYKETEMQILTHTGTHIDCPAHMLNSNLTTDNIDIKLFYGKAFVIDCSTKKEGEIISIEDLKKYDNQIKNKKIALIHTSWDKFWGNNKYFGKYPYLSIEAVNYLIKNGIKTIGLDVISIDSIDSKEFVNHLAILGSDGVIIENLCNLDKLLNKEFTFSALPLKIKEGDGSPVRAIAILNN